MSADVTHDLVLRGGRVVDPASGLDTVTDLAVDGDRVAAIGPGLRGRTELDATGCVVAPGFVDLHSHATDLDGQRLQAFDGVTTGLDLEAGVPVLDRVYAAAAAEGRHLHYGYSASWAAVRYTVRSGVPLGGDVNALINTLATEAVQGPASPDELARIIDGVEQELAAGGLGIGVLIGYTPGVLPEEYLEVARLAARHGVPTYSHTRDLVDFNPQALVDGAEEIVRAAAETGAHMHHCHVNSTSLRAVDRVLSLVDKVRSEGATLTTEAYPYGAGMTGVGAAFLAPELLAQRGLRPSSLVHASTGRRLDVPELNRLRAEAPGDLVVVHFLDVDVPEDAEILMRSLLFPDTALASDAMPMAWSGTPQPGTWPLPPSAVNHPRTSGTYSRSFDLLVRGGHLDVPEFVRRASTIPADVVAVATHGAVRKGRLAVGDDADVVVLDPEAFTDHADYDHPTVPSTGVRHLLVSGTPVIRGGAIDLDSRPGRPVRAS